MSPLKTISSFPAVMAVTLASAERVFEILDEPSTEVDQPGETRRGFEREVGLRGRRLQLRRGDPVLSDVSLRAAQGPRRRAGGAIGRGEDHAGRPAAPVPRSDRWTNRDGRRAPHPAHPAVAARAHGGRQPGHRAPQRHRPRQHRLRPPGASREQVEAAARAANADGFIAAAAAGLRHGARRARHPALGRAAPAHRHRARAAARSADPDPRRGHQRARHGVRAAGAAGHRPAHAPTAPCW